MKMNQRQISLALLVVPTILLMAMGLAFCWATPANHYYHLSGLFYFKHQLCWFVIGGSLATAAYLLGWRRWLNAAPYVAVGWAGLSAYAATCPLVNGHWGWISVGCFRINVLEFAPIVLSLISAYFVRIFRNRAPLAVVVGLLSFCSAIGYSVSTHRIRFGHPDHLPTRQLVSKDAKQKAYEFLQNQCVGAVRESRWFGKSDINTRFLPESITTSMPSAASVLFGKWYLILLTLGLAALGFGVGVSFCLYRNVPMQLFSLLWSCLVLLPSFFNILGCVGLVPVVEAGIPFSCFGGSLAISTMIGLAIILSQNRECQEGHAIAVRDWVRIGIPVLAFTIMTLYGIFSVQIRGEFNYLGASADNRDAIQESLHHN